MRYEDVVAHARRLAERAGTAVDLPALASAGSAADQVAQLHKGMTPRPDTVDIDRDNRQERQMPAAQTHTEASREISLGQVFIECECGHRETSPVSETRIAESNMAFHARSAMRPVRNYTAAEVIELMVEQGYEPEDRDRAADLFARWHARGDAVAVYQNVDLGHPEIGHIQITSWGSRAAQLEPYCGKCREPLDTLEGRGLLQFAHGTAPADGHEVVYPPEVLPDIGGKINYRYYLQGVYPPDGPDGMRRAQVMTGQPAADLAADPDQKWTTEEMQRDFEVQGFAAPYVVVRRRSDGMVGTLEFTHSPRVYFGWKEHEE